MLIVPIPYGHESAPMRWQADTGGPGTMNAGYFIGPDAHGRARAYGTGRIKRVAALVDSLWAGSPTAPDQVTAGKLRDDLGYWHPAAVVAVTHPGSRLAALLTGLLGRPAFRQGRLLIWRR